MHGSIANHEKKKGGGAKKLKYTKFLLKLYYYCRSRNSFKTFQCFIL